jgi:hypothetical protein
MMTKSASEPEIRQALANLDVSLEVDIKLAEMNPEERTKFLAMAQDGWLG